ncbi:MAG: Asp/Glu racemase [Gammaproteobacteria bacterium]|nr:MAG: Asp/Glu racemase [Gammaproteobacteria bacterium]
MKTQCLKQKPRVGLMVPSSNTVMETDFHRELQDFCSIHTARMYLVDTTRDAELEMIEQHAPAAAKDLETIKPDLLVFGCTSAGSLFGAKYDAELCEQLGKQAGAPTVGVLTAVTEQLDLTAGTRLAVITPYIDELTRSVADAATSGRRELVVAAGMGISDNVKLADPTPREIVEFASSHLTGQSFDILLASCTNFRALEAKPLLEDAFQVPVVTSNSAILEAIRRRFLDN